MDLPASRQDEIFTTSVPSCRISFTFPRPNMVVTSLPTVAWIEGKLCGEYSICGFVGNFASLDFLQFRSSISLVIGRLVLLERFLVRITIPFPYGVSTSA